MDIHGFASYLRVIYPTYLRIAQSPTGLRRNLIFVEQVGLLKFLPACQDEAICFDSLDHKRMSGFNQMARKCCSDSQVQAILSFQ
jgi:hypothetical protein